jgi:hypothetical protein
VREQEVERSTAAVEHDCVEHVAERPRGHEAGDRFVFVQGLRVTSGRSRTKSSVVSPAKATARPIVGALRSA